MTIERLQALKDMICQDFMTEDLYSGIDIISEDGEDLISLIDEKISQLSVTDEDVREAIEQVKWYIDFEKSEWANCDELSACELGAEQIYKDRLKNCETILIALQQVQKAQELEKENQGLKKMIEDMQRNLDAWNPRQSLNEPTTGNPMPRTSYTTSSHTDNLINGKLR